MKEQITFADPVRLLEQTNRSVIFGALLVSYFVLMFVMDRSMTPPKPAAGIENSRPNAAVDAEDSTPKAGCILDLEFAPGGEAGASIAAKWGSDGRIRAAFSLGLDGLFIVIYVSLLVLGCRMAADGFSAGGHTALATLAVLLGWAAVAAGVLDVIENCGVLAMIDGRGDALLARYTIWCARAKFTLSVSAAVYVLGAICVLRGRFFT